MEKLRIELLERHHDMPHEDIMDDLGLEFKDLTSDLQQEIRDFDKLYETALKDGIIDEQEEMLLITTSYKIAQKIKVAYPPKET